MILMFALLAGIACAGYGGELFVRGTVGLANCWRVAPGVLGATVAAFATSSPELSVAVSSAIAGTPEIALGDALGSNVVNVTLILALALVLGGSLLCDRNALWRDFPVALLVPVVTAVFCIDGKISRLDGGLLLLTFTGWLASTIVGSRRGRVATAEGLVIQRRGIVLAAELAVGLALLVGAGLLIVYGAKGLAQMAGIPEFVVGALVVALGTSTPELATTIIARLRGHDDIGLGTILGSNIFNGLFIVSVAALIRPIPVRFGSVVATLIFGFVTVLLVFPSPRGILDRRRGFILLALYAAFVATTWQAGH